MRDVLSGVAKNGMGCFFSRNVLSYIQIPVKSDQTFVLWIV